MQVDAPADSLAAVFTSEQKKWEPPLPTRVGKKKKRGPDPTQKRKLLR